MSKSIEIERFIFDINLRDAGDIDKNSICVVDDLAEEHFVDFFEKHIKEGYVVNIINTHSTIVEDTHEQGDVQVITVIYELEKA